MTALLPFKLVYHERYDLNLGPHVFPSQKFRLIHEMLLRESLASEQDFLRPNPASDEDILRVHTFEWVQKLKTGTLTASEIMLLEVPYSPELVEAVWLAAGGTILAAQSALRDGFGSNLSGGFHHAHPGHGEGFCAIHDVAVAIRKLQADGAIRKAMVVLRRSARRIVIDEGRIEAARPPRVRGSAATRPSRRDHACRWLCAPRRRHRSNPRQHDSRRTRRGACFSIRVRGAKLIDSSGVNRPIRHFQEVSP